LIKTINKKIASFAIDKHELGYIRDRKH